jgi:hypothetical protein
MQDGLYKVAFQTPLGEGFGVVTLKGGELTGGDSMMYYIGTYDQNGETFNASVRASQHSTVPGMSSVFGATNVQINLTGTSTGDSAVMKGSSPQAPGISFSAVMTKLG